MNRDRRKMLNKASAILNEQIATETLDKMRIEEVREIVSDVLDEEEGSYSAMEDAGTDQTAHGINSAQAIEYLEEARDRLDVEGIDEIDLEEVDGFILAAVDC